MERCGGLLHRSAVLFDSHQFSPPITICQSPYLSANSFPISTLWQLLYLPSKPPSLALRKVPAPHPLSVKQRTSATDAQLLSNLAKSVHIPACPPTKTTAKSPVRQPEIRPRTGVSDAMTNRVACLHSAPPLWLKKPGQTWTLHGSEIGQS